mgnify:CR=1 FL=1
MDQPSSSSPLPAAPVSAEAQPPRKGPLSFLSGALTAGLLGWICLGLSQRVVGHYALHPPSYSSAIAQSIATAMKTLIVGMSFLAAKAMAVDINMVSGATGGDLAFDQAKLADFAKQTGINVHIVPMPSSTTDQFGQMHRGHRGVRVTE